MNAQDDAEEPMPLDMPVFIGGCPAGMAEALALQSHQIAEHDLFHFAVEHAARPDISLDTIRFVASGLGARGGQKETRLALPPYPQSMSSGNDTPEECRLRHAEVFLRLALGVPLTPPVVQEFLATGKPFPGGASGAQYRNEEPALSSPEAWISVMPSLESRDLLMKEYAKGAWERRHGKMGDGAYPGHGAVPGPTLKERALRMFLVAVFAALGFWFLKHGGLPR